MAIETPLTRLLGIEHPILSAPMARSAGGRMAAAVSAAGGYGLLGGGYGDTDWLAREFAAAGNQRIGVGFITWSLDEDDRPLDAALAHRPAAVMLSFGDAAPYAPRIRDAGAKLILQVQDLAEAREAAALGADVVIAQGKDAGGHGRDVRGTFGFVPAAVDAIAPVPVVAAGGIADGRGLAAALVLGASGILMGTRFYVSAEALAPEEAKQAVVAGEGDDTFQTTVFDTARSIAWPLRYPGRAFRNAFSDRWHGRDGELTPDDKARYDAAMDARDYETAVVWAGEGADLVRDIPPAGDIVRRTAAQAEAILGKNWRWPGA